MCSEKKIYKVCSSLRKQTNFFELNLSFLQLNRVCLLAPQKDLNVGSTMQEGHQAINSCPETNGRKQEIFTKLKLLKAWPD